MIRTENLTFHYKPEEQTLSFPDIDLKENENLLLLGKSGVGKTTLLHLLAGLLKPISGKVFIDSTDINTLSSEKRDTFRGQNIGLVFQKKHAIPSLSILDNLKARLFFSKSNISNAYIEELLKELGLDAFKTRKVSELSEGQLQRLGIAMSVVHHPKIILADEPTSSLDDENCRVVIDLLKKQAEQTGASLVVITHDVRVQSKFSNSITL